MSATAHNPAQPVAIRAEGLRKRYQLGEHRSLQQTVASLLRRRTAPVIFEALTGVDLTCHRGEAIGIVGINGSGKSTLLQILAGTIVPTGGEMRVWGRVLPLLAVGQGFHPELTGRENVILFASSLGFRPQTISERMDAVTEFAELERHIDTPTKRFSSGMISRLSFAVGITFPADIYVFDEVLAVVDGEFQARCLEEIKGLHAAGRTVIFVSHNRNQVAEVCERVVWLEAGAVRDQGPTSDVLVEYEREHGSATPERPGARRRFRAPGSRRSPAR
jgi:ABC-2 type transport system ATP-binding protein/lipopolysaccharide transport system ATP-binding protein